MFKIYNMFNFKRVFLIILDVDENIKSQKFNNTCNIQLLVSCLVVVHFSRVHFSISKK